MTYYSVNYYYFNSTKDKKFKNKNVYSYVDKHLKKKIYSINSGLLTNSFLREKQFKSSFFSCKIKNVSLISTFLNKWGLLYIYPINYDLIHIKKLKLLNNIFKKYYFNKKRFINLNFFKLKLSNTFLYNNFIKSFNNKKKVYLLKKWKKQKSILKFFLINKVLYKYKWMSYYIDYRGSFFIIKKKFIKNKMKLRLYRGKVKKYFFHYLKSSTTLLKTLNNKYIHSFSFGKLYIYIIYNSYLYSKIFKIFNKYRFIRKNSFFGLYYFDKKKKLKIFNNQLKIIKNQNLLLKKNKIDSFYYLFNNKNILFYFFYSSSLLYYNNFFSNYIKIKLYRNIFINKINNFIYENQLFYYQNKIIPLQNNKIYLNTFNKKVNLKKCMLKGKWQALENQVDKK